MKAHFKNAAIKAIACAVPSHKISLDDELERLYKGDKGKLERVKKSVGLSQRRVCDAKTTAFDLCLHSALRLFECGEIAPSDIDGVVFATISPDFFSPNNAHLLHSALNLRENCACFDVAQACSGFVYGLFLAFMMCENSAQNVLLCVGDTVSKLTDKNDTSTASLIGDAGCAVLISRTQKHSFFNFYANGKEFENIIIPSGAFRQNAHLSRADDKSPFLFMDGSQMFSLALQEEPKMIEQLLDFAGCGMGDVDYVFFNQSNAYIVNALARHFGLNEQKAPVHSLAKYGYTGGASIPLAMCEQAFCENEGFLSHKKVLLSAFGVGVSLANAVLDFDEIHALKPLEFAEKDLKGYF